MQELLKKLDIIDNMLEEHDFTDKEFEFLLEVRDIIRDKIIHLVRKEKGHE